MLREMGGKRQFGGGVQYILGPRRARERPTSRSMIGVDMGINDEPDAHPGLVRDPEVWFDVPYRVHDGAGGVPAAAEQVGNRHRRSAWRN